MNYTQSIGMELPRHAMLKDRLHDGRLMKLFKDSATVAISPFRKEHTLGIDSKN